MSAAAGLERECRTFLSFLVGETPNAALIAKYVEAHAVLEGLAPRAPFDRVLVAVAGRARVMAAVASAYASVFARRSVLQKKLVLAAALAESNPPHYQRLDRVAALGRGWVALQLVGWGVRAVLGLAVGTLLLLPVQVALRVLPASR